MNKNFDQIWFSGVVIIVIAILAKGLTIFKEFIININIFISFLK